MSSWEASQPRFCIYHLSLDVDIKTKIILLQFLTILTVQDLLSSTWKMSEMLRMQFEDWTGLNLVERAAGFVLSGLSKNVILEGLEALEGLQLIQDPQKHCLSLILTQSILGQGTWRSTLNHMEKY